MSYSIIETFEPSSHFKKNSAIIFGVFYFLGIGSLFFDSYDYISTKMLDPKINFILLFTGLTLFLGLFYSLLKNKSDTWFNQFKKVSVDEEGCFLFECLNRADIRFSVSEIEKIRIYKSNCTIHLKDFSYVTIAAPKSIFSKKIVEHPKLTQLIHHVNFYKEFFILSSKFFLGIAVYAYLCYLIILTAPSLSLRASVLLLLFQLVLPVVVFWSCKRNKGFTFKESGLMASLMLAVVITVNATTAFSTDDLKFEEISALNSKKRYDDSLAIAKVLYNKYPDNSFVGQSYAFLLLKQGSAHADQVIAILENYPHEVKAKQIMACAYAEKKDWNKAMSLSQNEEFPVDSQRIKDHQACRVFAKDEVQLSSEAKK